MSKATIYLTNEEYFIINKSHVKCHNAFKMGEYHHDICVITLARRTESMRELSLGCRNKDGPFNVLGIGYTPLLFRTKNFHRYMMMANVERADNENCASAGDVICVQFQNTVGRSESGDSGMCGAIFAILNFKFIFFTFQSFIFIGSPLIHRNSEGNQVAVGLLSHKFKPYMGYTDLKKHYNWFRDQFPNNDGPAIPLCYPTTPL